MSMLRDRFFRKVPDFPHVWQPGFKARVYLLRGMTDAKPDSYQDQSEYIRLCHEGLGRREVIFTAVMALKAATFQWE